MTNYLFLLVITILPALLLAAGFKILPQEKWQIMGTVPVKKQADGSWSGLNLTYYGFFNALACSFSVSLVLILLGAINLSLWVILTAVLAVISACIPAARMVAGWVEKKSATLTIGGAVFVGYLFMPWALWGFSRLIHTGTPASFFIMAALSAISIGYVFGESIGRLACISFGCCYGKAMDDVHPLLHRLFYRHCFVFNGKTKKIAYAHGLDNRKIFPIQAVTSVFYLLVGTTGVWLYLSGFYGAAFLETVIATQIWRFASEFLRADYRGDQKISAYQIMSLILVVYSVFIAFIFHSSGNPLPAVSHGLTMVWQPAAMLCIQAVFVAVFLFTGRSKVTAANISFSVSHDHI